jgi:glutaredoxin
MPYTHKKKFFNASHQAIPMRKKNSTALPEIMKKKKEYEHLPYFFIKQKSGHVNRSHAIPISKKLFNASHQAVPIRKKFQCIARNLKKKRKNRTCIDHISSPNRSQAIPIRKNFLMHRLRPYP